MIKFNLFWRLCLSFQNTRLLLTIVTRTRWVLVYTLGFIAWSLSFNAYSQDFFSGTIEQVSGSGRTFVLNRGTFYGLESGMRAEFLWDNEQLNELIRLGRAELVKVTSERSYWLFEKIRQDIAFDPPVEVEFALTEKFSSGVRQHRMAQTKVVLNEGKHPIDPIAYQQNKQSQSPKELVKLEDKYLGGEQLVKTVVPREEDVRVSEYDLWYRSRSLEYIEEYRQELESRHPRSGRDRIDITDVEQEFYDQAYEGILNAYIRHNKAVRDDRERFYFDVRADKNYPQVRESISVENVFQRRQRKKREQAEVSDLAVARMERDGPLWSADMDQSELRHYFVQSGLEQEKRRQQKALGEVHSNELTFEFATSIASETNPDDEQLQGTNYSLGVAYEFHLARTIERFRRWSVLLGVDSSVSFYDIGGFNAIFSEAHLQIGLNYYFYNLPTTLRDYIGYAGIGIKRGVGEFRSAELEETYDIQSLRYPVYFGVKYRFSAGDERESMTRVGWGLNLRLSHEVGEKTTLGLSDEVFERSINPADTRFHIGISTYF